MQIIFQRYHQNEIFVFIFFPFWNAKLLALQKRGFSTFDHKIAGKFTAFIKIRISTKTLNGR